jgi:hypothetical protein
MANLLILRQSDVQAHLVNLALGLNAAVLELTEMGIFPWIPDSIEFDAVVIDQFQALAVNTVDNRNNSTVQGGTNTSVQTGTDVAVTTGTTNSSSNQTTTHGETVNTTDSGASQYGVADLTYSGTFPIDGSGYLNPEGGFPI